MIYKDGMDTKELDKMLEQVLDVMIGKNAWVACSVFAHAIAKLWLHLEREHSETYDKEFEELFNIIKRVKTRKSAMIKNLGFPLNQ